jgi:Uroporphyrinogen-III decarboxylase
MLDFIIPEKEIEIRKQLVRDTWMYRKIDHIPIMLSVDYNPWGYAIREEINDMEKQLKLRMHSVKKSLELIPDDYIPSMFINLGCVAIASALGAEIYEGDSSQQTPGVSKPILSDIGDIYRLKRPDPYKDGLLGSYMNRLKYFLDETERKIAVSCLDMNGPMAVASDILGSEAVYSMMYEAEDELLYLLNFITDIIIDITDASIKVAGDINHFTSTDFVYFWCPEGYKGHVSSDLCATYSPTLFKKFDIPVNNRIFEKYGPGLLHNCGPNPCAFEYLQHQPGCAGADLSYRYSKCDLEKIRCTFKGRGIVYFYYEGEPEAVIQEYRETMEALAPDVIAVPVYSLLDPSYDVNVVYGKLREISDEYAHRIWG